MQQGSDSNIGTTEAAAASSPSLFAKPDRENLSPPSFICSSGEFATAYPSVFSSRKSSPLPFSNNLWYSTSVSLTPSSVSCEDESNDAAATEHRLYLARLTLQYEEMLDRYELCLSHLEEAVAEAEALRLHNAKLRISNAELARRLSFLSPYGKRGGGLMEAASYPSSLVNELHQLHLGGDSPPSDLCPTSVPDYRKENRLTRKAPFPEQRSTLPKSISIRSSGYMKTPASSRNGRTRVCNPVSLGPQKVFVPVEQDEGEADGRNEETEAARLELEVCAQGMFKTELCDKWQQAGSCPYGQHCQFAHGIAELRPVIRHPRYKTEICRMILAGGTCPYGHRCHYRHVLTPEDYGLPGTDISDATWSHPFALSPNPAEGVDANNAEATRNHGRLS